MFLFSLTLWALQIGAVQQMLRYLNGLKELTQEKTCRETEENDVEEDGNLCPT